MLAQRGFARTLRGRAGARVLAEVSERLWYPLWDAGFVTGHGARTIKESIALADDDIDALRAQLNAMQSQLEKLVKGA